MKNHITIHGHFYQPPRENPWLEAIEMQDSAYPYHDWNERITAECYAPNALSRILDEEGRITEIVNNYSRISFNFGPTLLQWLEDHAPDVYEAVLEADRNSAERFGGHGSAMAQAYNHMIMPLANDRDRRTQTIWGIRDFEHRFGRKPEGMWLPETAADVPSLVALADQGIRFTILAPNQAARVRRLEDGAQWTDVSGGGVDPTRPYLVRLPEDREIVVFFYDGPVSQAVAFEGLLRSGDRFVSRLMDMYGGRSAGDGSADGDARGDGDGGGAEGDGNGAEEPAEQESPPLGHIATDGETYGHHHRHGDMALARALRVIGGRSDIRLTNYGQFLDLYPPRWEAEIAEGTSWSCAHGVERWRANCGCRTGGKPGWGQEWRAPLRNALDWLRDELIPHYLGAAGDLLEDPWAARDDYIDVILEREPEVIDRFFETHAARELEPDQRVRAMKLLEMQRHAMLMYTSCGWFFDELSGIETVQVMQYAGRAIQLAEDTLGISVEEAFLERLEKASSNLPQWGDGRRIYDRSVRGARISLTEVGAHFAIASLFGETTEQTREYCYDIEVTDEDRQEAGRARLSTGRITVSSRVTKEVARLVYGVLHLGDHTIHAGVRPEGSDSDFAAMREDVTLPFEAADFTETIRALDRHFPDSTFSLRSLFQDQRREVLDHIIASTLRDAESAYRQIYDRNAPLMRFLRETDTPLPAALSVAGEYVLNTSLLRAVSEPDPDLDRIESLLGDADRREIMLDTDGIAFAFRRTLESMGQRMLEDPDDTELLEQLDRAVRLSHDAPFDVHLWTLQNAFYELRREHSGTVRARAAAGDEAATEWLVVFRSLGEALGVAV